jgi:hypothetical protein
MQPRWATVVELVSEAMLILLHLMRNARTRLGREMLDERGRSDELHLFQLRRLVALMHRLCWPFTMLETEPLPNVVSFCSPLVD